MSGELALESNEERSPTRRPAEENQRVVRDADEGRRQHRHERLVVVAVVQEPEVGEQIDDLLLAEVASSRGPIGRQPLPAQRLLVALGLGSGHEEKHDLARGRLAGVHELPDASREMPGLGHAPVDAACPGRPTCR